MNFLPRTSPLVIITLVVLSTGLGSASGQAKKIGRTGPNSRDAAADAELARTRADLIQKMKESRAGAEKLVSLREEEVAKLTEQYKKRREFFYQGLISRAEVNQSELALAEAKAVLEADKRRITEQDIAISEALMREDLLRSPRSASGGHREMGALIRFDGDRTWTIADAPRIEKFFFQTFGRSLPISAYGQTAIHDHLQFDHSNGLDIAVHPDSQEGISLISYLRQSGIPFIAFRKAVTGSSTGAHIHIGRASPSLRAVTTR
jgi:hypothetical protein